MSRLHLWSRLGLFLKQFSLRRRWVFGRLNSKVIHCFIFVALGIEPITLWQKKAFVGSVILGGSRMVPSPSTVWCMWSC
ncbi:hypothetical protein Goshw_004514 [Gossypium schwendimanii]|uniref:Uncharacterized protein n=1 Tax=Gossypium schwendimanii TaxID=34291 RepID=A0A7J9LLM9_GOSSC|nr:hypothetical protein [Gossypium schwendimanii]